MYSLYLIIVFIAGLVIGSFLNVLTLRIDDLKSVLNTRSHCPSCKHTLAWYDLIPLFSFLFLKGKCRYCKKDISWQYPVVELSTGLMFLLLFIQFGFTMQFVLYLLVFSILTVVFVYDLKTQLVPENFVWVALIVAFFASWLTGTSTFWYVLLGGLIGGGLLAFLVIVSKEKWMGAGDIKIGLILGFLLSFPTAIFGIFLAFLLGSIAGLIYMQLSNKTMKDSLPFAPFLILATFISIFFGQYVVNWYLGSFIY